MAEKEIKITFAGEKLEALSFFLAEQGGKTVEELLKSHLDKSDVYKRQSEYKVEFVSPICEYADIPVIQELIRQLRHAGAVAGKNTGCLLYTSRCV